MVHIEKKNSQVCWTTRIELSIVEPSSISAREQQPSEMEEGNQRESEFTGEPDNIY